MVAHTSPEAVPSDAAASEGAAFESAASAGAVPDIALPDGAVPAAAVPADVAPDAALPDVGQNRFRTLPDPIRLEDTIAAHPAAPAPDLAHGDPDTDWLLRNAG